MIAMNNTELLKRLLPPGAYDPNAPLISAELQAEGNALDAAQMAAGVILAEADPRTTLLMLPDWERALGLPDPCAGALQTVEQRRAAVVAKITRRGGQTRAFFIALAAELGYAITIAEFGQHSVLSAVNALLYNWPWRFTWRVSAPLINTRNYTVLSAVNEPFSVSGNEMLECAILTYKPAHTFVQFAYS